MIQRLMSIFGYAKQPVAPAAPLSHWPNESRGDRARRWDAVKTDRLNSGHWAQATGNGINADIESHLEDLRTRSAHEISTNPMLEGIVETWVTDVVGSEHPVLQVNSDDDEYNRALEAAWREWWKMPDVNGELSGVDMLQLDVRMLWPYGEFLNQIVTDPNATGPVKMRLLNLNPRRLASPYGRISTDDVILGIKRSPTGKPLSYYISKADPNRMNYISAEYVEIPADQIIHGFRTKEPGQARGIPWAAAALQIIADLRDYDDQVLDAARQAADWAVFIGTESNDIPAVAVNENWDIERRRIPFLPPGYKPFGLTPPQPSTNYVDYRQERQRDIARAVSMPLMKIRLDSSNHNYSSARFDDQGYRAVIRSFQGWLARKRQNRLVDLVAREAELAGAIPKRPRGQVSYEWTWPVAPPVDQAKEANGEQTALQNMTLSLTDALAARGKDFDAHIQQLKREQEAIKAAGISLPANPANPTKPDDEDEDKPDGEDK